MDQSRELSQLLSRCHQPVRERAEPDVLVAHFSRVIYIPGIIDVSCFIKGLQVPKTFLRAARATGAPGASQSISLPGAGGREGWELLLVISCSETRICVSRRDAREGIWHPLSTWVNPPETASVGTPLFRWMEQASPAGGGFPALQLGLAESPSGKRIWRRSEPNPKRFFTPPWRWLEGTELPSNLSSLRSSKIR